MIYHINKTKDEKHDHLNAYKNIFYKIQLIIF